MVWARLLLIAALLGPLPSALVDESPCTAGTIYTGCPTVTGTNDGDGVTLHGDVDHPGHRITPGGGPIDTTPPPPCGGNLQVGDRCRAPRVGGGPNGTPDISISDIATFHPTAGVERMEPDGWVVVGLPANIYAVTAPHLVPGELLGRTATVRFTPISYHWTYGDGTGATRATMGGTWAGLGLAEFDPTPTSHIYRDAGDYVIHLTIDFRAEYRFNGGAFLPVTGVLSLPANPLYITAGGAKTVLVERPCTVDPRGPGC